MQPRQILKSAHNVLQIEADGILALNDRLDDSFVQAINILLNCRGRVVVLGMGKSGIISRKIAATLSSTGTPSFFLHAGEANHGDLGMIMGEDIILAISNSGETEELLKILPVIKRLNMKLISICGNPKSTLARSADASLDASVEKEACALGLAPTASTTVALALGDALAVVLMEKRGFEDKDFALIHPNGTLGRRLLLRVEDLMHKGEDVPLVKEEETIKNALLEITSKRLRLTGVVNDRSELVGIITDGDLRKILEKEENIFHLKAKDIMTRGPRIIAADALAVDAVKIMKENFINSLFIMHGDGKKPLGVVHLHDILKAGLL